MLSHPLGTILLPDLPVVAPDDRLLQVIRSCCAGELEFLPVVASGRGVGLIPVTRIFDATAGLVLTPEDEGIKFDQ